MGKAWKRYVHRHRTWGANQQAPAPKATPPAPVAEEAVVAPEIIDEIPSITTQEEVPAEKPTTKTSIRPKTTTKTKRSTRKTPSTKKK